MTILDFQKWMLSVQYLYMRHNLNNSKVAKILAMSGFPQSLRLQQIFLKYFFPSLKTVGRESLFMFYYLVLVGAPVRSSQSAPAPWPTWWRWRWSSSSSRTRFSKRETASARPWIWGWVQYTFDVCYLKKKTFRQILVRLWQWQWVTLLKLHCRLSEHQPLLGRSTNLLT